MKGMEKDNSDVDLTFEDADYVKADNDGYLVQADVLVACYLGDG